MIRRSFYKISCVLTQNETHYQPQMFLINIKRKEKGKRGDSIHGIQDSWNPTHSYGETHICRYSYQSYLTSY